MASVTFVLVVAAAGLAGWGLVQREPGPGWRYCSLAVLLLCIVHLLGILPR